MKAYIELLLNGSLGVSKEKVEEYLLKAFGTKKVELKKDCIKDGKCIGDCVVVNGKVYTLEEFEKKLLSVFDDNDKKIVMRNVIGVAHDALE